MKKSTVIKVACIILLLSLVLGNSPFSYALPVESINADEAAIVTHVRESLVIMDELAITKDDTVYLGSKLSAYYIKDDTLLPSEYESYPVYINGKIASIVDVVRIDGEVSQVTIGVSFARELQQVLSQNLDIPFTIIYDESGVYLKFSNQNEMICLMLYGDTSETSSLNATNKIVYENVAPKNLIDIQASVSPRTMLSKKLNLSQVSNTSVYPCCRGGICWAASIAMIANYYKGTSYSALGIHDMCNCKELKANYHPQQMLLMEDLGLYVQGRHYSFTFNSLYNCIENDQLLLLDLQSSSGAHNVVAYGYYSNTVSDVERFHYMCPNVGARYASFPSSGTVSFTLSGIIYTVHCVMVVSNSYL